MSCLWEGVLNQTMVVIEALVDSFEGQYKLADEVKLADYQCSNSHLQPESLFLFAIIPTVVQLCCAGVKLNHVCQGFSL